MGEYVWTQFKIGGKISREKLNEFESDFGEKWNDLDFENGTIEGEQNYGTAEEEEAFFQENGIPYVLISGAAGGFGASVKAWRPGMEGAICFGAEEDTGKPMATAEEIRHGLEAGTIPELLETMAICDPANLPSFEIIETVEGNADA